MIIRQQQQQQDQDNNNNNNVPPPPPQEPQERQQSQDYAEQNEEALEAAQLRMENEAHVAQRRQSRVMIVKSKISSEIQRGPRRMIEYVEDSPFFWSLVKESENRIRRLSLRLNQLL